MVDEFIEKTVQQMAGIEKKSRTAWWNAATLGEEKYETELKEAQISLRKLFSSKEGFSLLNKERFRDAVKERERTLLLQSFKENQISTELIEIIVKEEVEVESIYTNFRPKLNGTAISNNDLKKIFTDSPHNDLRQKAWEASKAIGEEVEKKVLNLISLRNKAAAEAGYKDYYSMQLELQEIDQKRLFALLEELVRLTTPIWKVYKEALDQGLAKKFDVAISDLRPWHYSDPFFQEAPQDKIDFDPFYEGKDILNISHNFYEKIGFPITDILESSDLYERDKKSQHAFCSCIDRKQDVRILCNLRSNEYWMGTQLHELGHAVYDKFLPPDLPYLLRSPAHISTTEAIAMLFGRLSKDPTFLTMYCGVDERAINPVADLCRFQNGANLLVFARWVLVMAYFERAMYQDKGADLRKAWWDIVEKYQWVKRPDGRHKPDWASKLHLACAPVYYQNYLLGEMTASQLKHKIEKELLSAKESFISSPKVAEFLKQKLFALGATYPWEETIIKATGEPLNPHYFAADLKSCVYRI